MAATILVKDIIYEDFCNYKSPSMFIVFPSCTFKCEKECGERMCQNSGLVHLPSKNIGMATIINQYINNPITKAIVCGGLEPFDSWEDLQTLISYLRVRTTDDIVIYTGYNKNELLDKIPFLKSVKNIIVKFGRYVPNQSPHYDPVLGVNLASDNQYAERIS